MNKLQEAIAKVSADEQRGELQETLLQMLLEKQRELGDDISEEEARLATEAVFLEYMVIAMREIESNRENNEEEDVWDENMENAMEVVRSTLRKGGWKFWEYIPQKGVRTVELTASENGKRFQVKIYLEALAKACRIDVIYPFQAEKAYLYPLCEKLLTESCARRFGSLRYDERDGELSYQYSFPVTHGLYEDDFENTFMAVMLSAYASYDEVRKYTTGRFGRAERNAIICRAQELIVELDR